MNADELARVTADPIQTLGASFYFDAPTVGRAKEIGLNVYEFYGLGRAGVMGNVEPDVVQRAFTFFHPDAIAMIYTRAREKADPAEAAQHYVRAAYEFADRTFGAVSTELLGAFAAAVDQVAANVETGRHLLFDGYHRAAAPTDPVHAAYLGTIVLRELRGGVHIEAVAEAGLSPSEATYAQDPSLFALHGYGDADVPPDAAPLSTRKADAEVRTDASMAGYFSVLNDDERQTLADATLAMFAALKSPVAVTR